MLSDLAAGCVAFLGTVELDRVNQEFVGLVWCDNTGLIPYLFCCLNTDVGSRIYLGSWIKGYFL